MDLLKRVINKGSIILAYQLSAGGYYISERNQELFDISETIDNDQLEDLKSNFKVVVVKYFGDNITVDDIKMNHG